MFALGRRQRTASDFGNSGRLKRKGSARLTRTAWKTKRASGRSCAVVTLLMIKTHCCRRTVQNLCWCLIDSPTIQRKSSISESETQRDIQSKTKMFQNCKKALTQPHRKHHQSYQSQKTRSPKSSTNLILMFHVQTTWASQKSKRLNYKAFTHPS
jgi:hypothetical protein